ncbi:MAG: glycosyltransferase family 1 protein [Microcystis wesenbergii Mw_QC_S_20081001_S30D]|jgi:glycosyltransferase involved in cell wall biosynthesis|uniref:Glycosyltransferase family 1 protein n=1 Tax=Microcystis wesenbergii Mw_QC_S_20081001_S30D TaxID=2486245 RepID=A0A552JL36_9CHRO|nr:MAG: glycosyltransferase family 1 protein [Microcystis wesenbergii Mw_QC_S_20081001_S30D]TRV02678.1 MAG: glycosyltransferase family 1 protein [Microcystis wesenbergii Mw_QC_S_20081001_S30]TRV04230.1 MAG: glycosyltransferase family 1 protein [Microcystis wesenbergii Mw_QC_B_20070930_S4D]TRV14903.1 MAG: glycosyltransferase family 1 protein [Microcystis wesenbergii Mw_QC_B_20070930_S4]
MKINWFSPLPPARTDIAEYTVRVLPGLIKNCQLELWTDQTIYDREISRCVKVNHYQIDQMPWSAINHADINIYHIGNNPDFHGNIWQISCRCPGIVVLHDLKLQHFFGGIYRELNQDKVGYINQMLRYYGIEGALAAEKFWNCELSTEFMAEYYPLTPLALKNALGVICHGQQTYQQLKQENLWLTGYLPLPYPSQGQSLIQETEKATEKQFYQLIIFGYIGVNRCLELVLDSLASFPQKQAFRLDIYGEVWDSNYLLQKINSLNLNNLVTLHGFVTEAKLETALANADLAINLRYPTMGEASGSQLRIWSHGLPSLVTKIGWYSELPENTVGYVTVGNEIADLHQHFSQFLHDLQFYQTIGKNGQIWLENNHSPESYAKALVDFAQEACQQRYRHAANYFIEKVGKEISYWNDDQISDLELKSIAETIHFLTS